MNPSQRGLVTGGVWLIGPGVIFLVQQTMDFAWAAMHRAEISIAGGVGSVRVS